ncbi:putrescine hydroxycinnamoyltransferase 1-like [Phoenix dactylifera]|uniref:Putrescine hydroxycinnamoyltransferase 1-like n=1 Tax=Phoenix dactylifera TaxID=42345 RepID=A0A8B7BIK1_PHODC|nr:putrescine hydroxycinnamoyltransferase 1-like [Phoenix dactylifera]
MGMAVGMADVGMVEVVESGFVVPSEGTPKKAIWLSNLDVWYRRYYTATVYVYRPNGDPNFFSVEAMKAALGKALVPFYPMAGRLGVDRDGRLEIQCTGEGVLFVVARSKFTLRDFKDSTPSVDVRPLLVPPVESAEPPCILLMLQVTFLKCGGVCLGVNMHHSVADGPGSIHFINTFSDIARGVGLTAPPFLNRTLLRPRSPPTVLFDHAEYLGQPSGDPLNAVIPLAKPVLLKVSRDQLDSLKSGNRSGLSTFRALSAHVWRCACKARELHSVRVTRLNISVDARSRLEPPLPPTYFGNAAFRTSVVATAGEVLSDPLEHLAEKIHGATVRSNDELFRSLIDVLEQVNMSRMHVSAWALPGTDLYVVSWLRMPIYEADFGWGKPAFMGMTAPRMPCGMVHIMRSPGDDGGISLVVTLETENMPRFKKLFYEGLEGVESA